MRRNQVIEAILPPIAQRLVLKMARRRDLAKETGLEKSPDFYDRSLFHAPHYLKHYTDSPNYFLWTVIIDRLRNLGSKSVLEVGCGTGQLACAIRDAGIIDGYCGFDFSKKRILHARSQCPEYQFQTANAYTTNLYEEFQYDTVIATEVLEHLEKDLEVVEAIKSGAHVLATLPNFMTDTHVRCFRDAESLRGRYSHLLKELKVDQFLCNKWGKRYFLLEGIRKG